MVSNNLSTKEASRELQTQTSSKQRFQRDWRKNLALIICHFMMLIGLIVSGPAATLAHEGDNEAFVQSGDASSPQEVEADPQSIRALGIKTIKMEALNIGESLKATGDVQADETKVFHVNAPVPAVVKQVLVKQGDVVKPGQTLAIAHSIEIAGELTRLLNDRVKMSAELERAKTDYTNEMTLQGNQIQLAKSALDREEALLKEGISARRSYIEAKSAYDSAVVKKTNLKQKLEVELELYAKQLGVLTETAKDQLEIMGIPDTAVETSLRTGKVSSDLYIKAPVAGCVIKRDINPGGRIDPSKTIFSIVDTSKMWIMVDIFQEQIPSVNEGQTVLLQTPSGERLKGRISSVGSVVDETTRTLHVRIIADNTNNVLRPGMFVTAQILLKTGNHPGFYVPESAIVSYKEHPYVFVHETDEGHFAPIEVKMGATMDGNVEITEGLKNGDIVVTSGATQLLAQSMVHPNAGHHHHTGEEHQAHDAEKTPSTESKASTIMGFGMGIAFTIGLILLWAIISHFNKKPEAQ